MESQCQINRYLKSIKQQDFCLFFNSFSLAFSNLLRQKFKTNIVSQIVFSGSRHCSATFRRILVTSTRRNMIQDQLYYRMNYSVTRYIDYCTNNCYKNINIQKQQDLCTIESISIYLSCSIYLVGDFNVVILMSMI